MSPVTPNPVPQFDVTVHVALDDFGRLGRAYRGPIKPLFFQSVVVKTGTPNMPWTANDAESHTHKATRSELKELWAKVANETLERNGGARCRPRLAQSSIAS
jgi:hypothetical protein